MTLGSIHVSLQLCSKQCALAPTHINTPIIPHRHQSEPRSLGSHRHTHVAVSLASGCRPPLSKTDPTEYHGSVNPFWRTSPQVPRDTHHHFDKQLGIGKKVYRAPRHNLFFRFSIPGMA